MTRFFNGTDIKAAEGTIILHNEALHFFYREMDRYAEPNVVDVGTGHGSFLLLAALHPGASIIGFEPLQTAWDMATENVILNGLQIRTHIYRTALWSKRGVKPLSVPQERRYRHKATLAKAENVKWSHSKIIVRVATRSLDEMIHHTDQVDLIKVHVNGAELEVMLGAEQTIRRCKPDMLIRFNTTNCAQFMYNRGMIPATLDKWGAIHTQALPDWLWVTWPER